MPGLQQRRRLPRCSMQESTVAYDTRVSHRLTLSCETVRRHFWPLQRWRENQTCRFRASSGHQLMVIRGVGSQSCRDLSRLHPCMHSSFPFSKKSTRIHANCARFSLCCITYYPSSIIRLTVSTVESLDLVSTRSTISICSFNRVTSVHD